MKYIKARKLSKSIRYLLPVFLLVVMVLSLVPTNSVLAAGITITVSSSVGPTITTQSATDLTTTSANLHGTVVDDGSLVIDKRGFESIGTPIIETELNYKAYGGIYVNGYIYIIQYRNPGFVIKFSATNYVVSSTLVPTHSGINAGPLWDIIYAAGYI